MTKRVELGDKVRDVLSGIEGHVFGISSYLTGCDHIGIKRQGVEGGKALEMHWADEPCCEVIEKKALKLPGDTSDRNKGGPALNAPSRR